MKTSEEMARSVMTRAKAKRADQRRNLITGVAALLCVCCIGAGVWMVGRTPANKVDTLQVQPTVSQQGADVELRPLKISLLAYAAEADDIVILESGIRVPGQQQIRVLDLRGMTEDEIQAAYEAEKEYAASVVEQFRKPNEDAHSCFFTGKNAMVTVISAGCLHVPIEDPDLVESVRVSVTGDGQMWHIETLEDVQIGESIPGEYIAEGGQLKQEWTNCGGVNMIWMLSGEKKRELGNDPTIALTSITSTITTTVNMKDGAKLTSVVDVTVDEEGFVYFTSRSETTV